MTRHQLLQMLQDEFGAGYYVIKSGQNTDWPGLTLRAGQMSGSSVTISFGGDTTLVVGIYDDKLAATRTVRLDLNHAESINKVEALIRETMVPPFSDY